MTIEGDMQVQAPTATIDSLPVGATYVFNSELYIKLSLGGGITGTGNPNDAYVCKLADGVVMATNKGTVVVVAPYKAVPA